MYIVSFELKIFILIKRIAKLKNKKKNELQCTKKIKY